MYLNSQQAKLFIKVDGVVGYRRRICTFCNTTIYGAEKIVETTRKLRRGPYFPQLALLQTSIRKTDTLGRAVVCLPCFHQLLRQWNSYEMKEIPMSRRVYKHVSDKGVKNYQETRAAEIRAEAEKRAFAIQTNQEHIVKKAFDKLSKRLDSQEEIIQQSEECIEKLTHKLTFCTKGEQWKINREVQNHQKIISAAEARIEDEEDKEELIRNETKLLLEVYRNNQSLFRAVSEPNLFQGNFENQEEKPIVFEDCTNGVFPQQVESSRSSHTVDNRETMSREQQFTENEYNYNENEGTTVIKAMRISESEDETDSYSQNARNTKDAWAALEPSGGCLQKQRQPHRDSDWHMTKEIIYQRQSNEVESFPEDERSKERFVQKQRESTPDDSDGQETGKIVYSTQSNEVQHENERSKRRYVQTQHQSVCDESDRQNTRKIIDSTRSNEVESFPEDEWSKTGYVQKQRGLVRDNSDGNITTEVVYSAQLNEVKDEDEWSKQGYVQEQRDTAGENSRQLNEDDKYFQNQFEPIQDQSDSNVTRVIVYSARLNEVQSLPEDEWSKLLDKEETRHKKQPKPTTIECTSVTWSSQRNNMADNTAWRQTECDKDQRAERKGDEIVDSDCSENESEQVDTANASLSNHHFQTRGSYDVHHVFENILPNRESETTIKTSHEHVVSSEPELDPWYQIDKEKEKLKTLDPHGHSASEGRFSPKNEETKEDKDYTDENYDKERYPGEDSGIMMQNDQDCFEEREILWPRRLDPRRFTVFTKSSYTPELVKQRDSASSKKYNGIQQTQNDVRIIKVSSFSPEERNAKANNVTYDPLEPLRKNRNMRDRHLSVEEEEWEAKHLSPKRLDETKWFSHINGENTKSKSFPVQHNVYIREQNNQPTQSPSPRTFTREERQTNKAEGVTINSTFAVNKNNNNRQDENGHRLNERFDASPSSNSEGLRKTHVERSPALRKLDEISEEPTWRVTTKTSGQNSPWDDLESQTKRRDFELRNEQGNENISGKSVGKIDLKRWSSEVERNRSFESKAPIPPNNPNTDKTRFSSSFKQSSLRASQLSEDNNSPSVTSPTRLQHYKGSVIIEDEQCTMGNDDQYLNRKCVGRVNLGLWGKNDASQVNGLSSTSKVSPSDENRSQSIKSQRDNKFSEIKNGTNSSQFESRQQLQHVKTSFKKKPDNTGQQEANDREISAFINHRSLNESLSEDELAWEKRFSKSYERNTFAEIPEEQVIQRKVSDRRIPRLGHGDNNNNHLNFGKISLDDDEVRRVRHDETKSNNRTEGTYMMSKASIDRNNESRENSASTNSRQSIKTAGDTSQLTEEELVWEEKTNRPGRLDFSKFSQFK